MSSSKSMDGLAVGKLGIRCRIIDRSSGLNRDVGVGIVRHEVE